MNLTPSIPHRQHYSRAVNGSVSHIDTTRVSDARSAFCSCSTLSESAGSSSMLQFFIRMMSEGNAMVIHAYADDTVKSLHERIQSITGIPVFEQRLIYRGKQLRWEQSLAECSIQNDANLQLVGRMRSTDHPQAWQVVNDMVALICRLCRGEMDPDALKTIKGLMTSYLNTSPGADNNRADNNKASDYFQIFMSSSAPAVLIMLYMSPFKVLEFCKLLRRVACEDLLYLACRSTLGFLLENAGVLRGSENVKRLVFMQEIFPFVRELAKRLLAGLDLSMKSPSGVGLMLSDVRDFSAFLQPLRTAIGEKVASMGPISVPSDGKSHKHPLCSEEIEILHVIFCKLLQKMDDCLNEMEVMAVKEGDVVYSAWSQYLSILKELNNISKLYQGAELELWTVLRQ
ncbi:E3 ubiquitin-protein ligase UPL5 [Quillaja saponaria]|uniref:E3 ubiquitin-protein ligase UPL5 n=1 Tax=Quillaja saponaria TaxID=32244 RepID=A0AAD7M0S8_QUISA|nr:E3 ubiquitin-protein ligase UPL5 [Quillaja saponaria]